MESSKDDENTYYRLNDNCALRGWPGSPYALYRNNEGSTFYELEEYRLLLHCDGKEPISRSELSEKQERLLDDLLGKGYIATSPVPFEEGLSAWQEYRKYPARHISFVHWSITGSCNARCRHCLVNAPDFSQRPLNLSDLRRIVDELKRNGVENIHLTGGEPLVRSDFFDLVDYIISNGMQVETIYSNGILINDDFIDKLVSRGIKPSFQLSLDGIGHHDWLRGVDGLEKKLIDIIPKLVGHGFHIHIAMVVHKGNLDSIPETVKLLSSLGVEDMAISPMLPLGKALSFPKDLILSEEEFNQALYDFLPLYFDMGCPIGLKWSKYFLSPKGGPVSPDDKRLHIVLQEKDRLDPARKDEYLALSRCREISSTFHIDPNGYVIPCMGMEEFISKTDGTNILRTPLASILNRKDSQYNRVVFSRFIDVYEKNSQCRDCEYFYACKGGCPLHSLTYSGGNVDAADLSNCAFFKGGLAQKIHDRAVSLVETHLKKKNME